MATDFVIQTIPLATVTKDGYQRDRIDSWVEHIAANFDLAEWDLPKVVYTGDGAYRVIAGQHRIEAARLLQEQNSWPFSTPVGEIEVQVVLGIENSVGEAVLFMKDARNKKALSPYDKHRASLHAREPRALEIQQALDQLGIPLVKRQRAKNGASLTAITAVYRLYDRAAGSVPDDGKLVYETLRLASLWKPGDLYRFDGLLLQGLGWVAQEHLKLTGKVKKLEALVRRTEAITIAGMAQKYSVDHAGVFSNTPMPYAAVIRERL